MLSFFVWLNVKLFTTVRMTAAYAKKGFKNESPVFNQRTTSRFGDRF